MDSIELHTVDKKNQAFTSNQDSYELIRSKRNLAMNDSI